MKAGNIVGDFCTAETVRAADPLIRRPYVIPPCCVQPLPPLAKVCERWDFREAFLGPFQRDEFGGLFAGICHGVGIVAGEPLSLAGFEMFQHGTMALHVAAKYQCR